MNQNSKIDLVQFMNRFSDIFENIDLNNFFIQLINGEKNYWTMLNDEQKNEIEEMLNLMVENARVEESRKEQQNFFYPVLGALNKPDLKSQFENDKQFRGAVLALSLIFLAGYHKMDENDQSHHKFISNNIKEAIKKIIA